MRKLTQPQAASLLTAVIVVVGLVIWFNHINLHQPPPVSPPSENTGGATTTSNTTTNPPLTTQTSPVTLTDTSAPTEEEVARLKLLNDRSANFLRAYYKLLPSDTSASRHQRLIPFASPTFFNQTSLKISDKGTPAGKARVSSRLEVMGDPVPSQLVIKSLNDDHTLMQVSIPVTVTTKTPNGTAVNSTQQQTTSRWNYDGRNWLIVTFYEGGEKDGK